MQAMRILIVSDHTDLARTIQASLDPAAYDVTVSTVYGTVDPAGPDAPDLMVLDVALHGDASVATADALRDNHSIPVVFMGTAADEARLREAGAATSYECLVPPFSTREIRLTIDVVICRHRAEVAGHELEGFFAVSLDMFCFLDMDGYFRRLNPAWERTLGYTRKELMSRRSIEFVHPDDRERTTHQNARVRSGEPAIGFENRYMCKDGSYRWFLWNATLHATEGLIYSAARDITLRKQAEAEREELTKQLEASLAEVRALQDILPICMYCRKVRDDRDYWQTVESYITQYTTSRFSHGICPSCMATEIDPQFSEDDDERP